MIFKPYVVIDPVTAQTLGRFDSQEEAEDAVREFKNIDRDEESPEGEYEIERICEYCETSRPLSEKECGQCAYYEDQWKERLHSYRM